MRSVGPQGEGRGLSNFNDLKSKVGENKSSILLSRGYQKFIKILNGNYFSYTLSVNIAKRDTAKYPW